MSETDKLQEKQKLPIGFMDSGLGGLSVLREAIKLMPKEDFIYYGDSLHAPYGVKPQVEIRDLTFAVVEKLLDMGIKGLAVACNTATSAAIHILREKYQKEIPVIGIEPALKPAVSVKENPRVLVMATPMTLREKKFHNLMQKFQDQAEIIPLPCPGLVEFVERGELSGEALEHFLKNLFAPYQERKVDAVVLGCTHYPLVRKTIQKVLGSGVAVFDGGAGTARETLHKLKEYSLVSDAVTPGTVQFYNSTEDQAMIRLSRYLLEHVN